MIASMLGSARSASSNLNGLAELLRQAVVEVRSGDSGSGTGIIWGGAGLVVTNAHCIRRGVRLQVDAGGKWREAQAIAFESLPNSSRWPMNRISGRTGTIVR